MSDWADEPGGSNTGFANRSNSDSEKHREGTIVLNPQYVLEVASFKAGSGDVIHHCLAPDIPFNSEVAVGRNEQT